MAARVSRLPSARERKIAMQRAPSPVVVVCAPPKPKAPAPGGVGEEINSFKEGMAKGAQWLTGLVGAGSVSMTWNLAFLSCQDAPSIEQMAGVLTADPPPSLCAGILKSVANIETFRDLEGISSEVMEAATQTACTPCGRVTGTEGSVNVESRVWLGSFNSLKALPTGPLTAVIVMEEPQGQGGKELLEGLKGRLSVLLERRAGQGPFSLLILHNEGINLEVKREFRSRVTQDSVAGQVVQGLEFLNFTEGGEAHLHRSLLKSFCHSALSALVARVQHKTTLASISGRFIANCAGQEGTRVLALALLLRPAFEGCDEIRPEHLPTLAVKHLEVVLVVFNAMVGTLEKVCSKAEYAKCVDLAHPQTPSKDLSTVLHSLLLPPSTIPPIDQPSERRGVNSLIGSKAMLNAINLFSNSAFRHFSQVFPECETCGKLDKVVKKGQEECKRFFASYTDTAAEHVKGKAAMTQLCELAADGAFRMAYLLWSFLSECLNCFPISVLSSGSIDEFLEGAAKEFVQECEREIQKQNVPQGQCIEAMIKTPACGLGVFLAIMQARSRDRQTA